MEVLIRKRILFFRFFFFLKGYPVDEWGNFQSSPKLEKEVANHNNLNGINERAKRRPL